MTVNCVQEEKIIKLLFSIIVDFLSAKILTRIDYKLNYLSI